MDLGETGREREGDKCIVVCVKGMKGRGKGFWAVLELRAFMVLALSERDSLSA